MTLHERRIKYDLIFVFKLLLGMINLDLIVFLLLVLAVVREFIILNFLLMYPLYNNMHVTVRSKIFSQ